MKGFTKKGLFNKLIVVLVILILFNAIFPTNVTYAGDNDVASTVGGSLLSPVVSLLIGLGDILMNIMHNVIYDMDESYVLINRRSTGWGVFWTIVAVIVTIAVVALLAYITAGGALALLGHFGLVAAGTKLTAAAVGVIVSFAVTSGVVVGTVTALDWFGDNIVFPMYQLSPEEIFKNKVGFLDANFFNPKPPPTVEKPIMTGVRENWIHEERSGEGVIDQGWEALFGAYYTYGGSFDVNHATNPSPEDKILKQILDKINDELGGDGGTNKPPVIQYEIPNSGWTFYTSKTELTDNFSVDENGNRRKEFLGNVHIRDKSSEETFLVEYRQEVITYDNPTGETYTWTDELTITIRKNIATRKTETVQLRSIADELKGTVAKWYYTVRNFVLVVMMVILLYIGIRIMLCGIASENAKYKNMLMDWIVAICLVFVMHYIMSFAMNLAEGITSIFSTITNDDKAYINAYEVNDDVLEKIKEALAEYDIDVNSCIETRTDGKKYFYWNAGNTVGLVRIKAALCESGTMDYLGFGIVFLVLVFYTVFFLFTYMKRVLYLAFFTIIAPFVAMTYPIDKIHDGKAQAFEIWFKEYIFNLMIQPVHLLLYTILIDSAIQLASENIIYTLVAIGFMMPAEKFIRKMFGFEKAQTPGLLGGAAGAALMMSGMNKLFHRRPSKGGSMTDDGEKSSEKEDKINVKDDDDVDPFLLSQQEKDKGNMNNVLSNEEKERQRKLEEQKMKDAMAKAQLPTLGETNPFLSQTKKDDKKIGFNKAEGLNTDAQKQKKAMQEDQKKRQEKVKKNRMKGIKSAAKKYAKVKLARTAKNIQNGKPIRDMARFAGGLYMGAAGALLGATFGIASGELKNVGGYGATLGAAGYALGSRDIKTDKDIGTAYQEYERAQFESEEAYRQYLLEQQREQYKYNDKYLEQLRTYLKLEDTKSAREYMENYGEFLDAGVTDMEDFAAAVKAVEEEGWSREMAMTASKYYKKAGGKPKNMNKKDRENIEYQYKNIVKANGITDDAQVDETVRIMLKNLDKYGSIKDDLTSV